MVLENSNFIKLSPTFSHLSSSSFKRSYFLYSGMTKTMIVNMMIGPRTGDVYALLELADFANIYFSLVRFDSSGSVLYSKVYLGQPLKIYMIIGKFSNYTKSS